MRRVALALVAVAASASLVSAQQTLTYPDLVRWTWDLDQLWQPPPPGTRCIQFSSYDRKSDAGPKDHDAWVANADYAQFLRTEKRGDTTDYVMVDVDGPGAVVRLWSANPKGTLSFWVDGGKEPAWQIDFAELCSGSHAPFSEPLCGVHARGHNCYVPMPFQEHLKVTCDQHDFYYQVDVRLLPHDTRVPTLSSRLFTEHASDLEAACQKLAAAGTPPWQDGWVLRRGGGTLVGGSAVAGCSTEIDGPGVLRALRVQIESRRGATVPRGEILRGCLLLVRDGSHELLRMPVADFFGSAPELAPYATLTLGATDDGWGWCHFPMPVHDRLTLAVMTDDPKVQADCRWEVRFEPREVPADALSFHASWHSEKDVPTKDVPDHRVLAAGGPGRFVGCALMVRNPTKDWWGEGDERIWVDGEDFPSTFGTGTEDYFGYAWSSNQLFQSAYHAQSRCDGPGNYGYTAVARMQIADAIPFQDSLRFELEMWHWNRAIAVDYASTAYWYGAMDASSGLPSLPSLADRLPAACPPLPYFVAEDALEGERLKVSEMTGGKRSAQDLGGFEPGRWSRDQQLWWREASVGDRLVLEVPVPQAGRYDVQAVLTKAPDYGVVALELGSTPLGEPIDLWADKVEATDVLTLGRVSLPAGSAPLTVEIVGANPQAKPGHMFGLDYLRLVPVQTVLK